MRVGEALRVRLTGLDFALEQASAAWPFCRTSPRARLGPTGQRAIDVAAGGLSELTATGPFDVRPGRTGVELFLDIERAGDVW